MLGKYNCATCIARIATNKAIIAASPTRWANPSFLSRHQSAETLWWLWYGVGLISIFMNPMCMRLNYKMASASFNKIKLAAGV